MEFKNTMTKETNKMKEHITVKDNLAQKSSYFRKMERQGKMEKFKYTIVLAFLNERIEILINFIFLLKGCLQVC